jgi:hypothetical protein
VANEIVVGFSSDVGAGPALLVDTVVAEPRLISFLGSTATASCTTPACVSAISLTCTFVNESLNLLARLCTKIVVGPLKCKNNLSPQIVFRANVLTANKNLETAFHVAVLRISRPKRVSGSHDVSDGICRFSVVDLKRYGDGADWLCAVYAITLDGCTMYSSSAFSWIW